MCCSREHYPAVAKEWTASCSSHHAPWPPTTATCFHDYGDGDSCGEQLAHAHLALGGDWAVCVRPARYVGLTGDWEEWPAPAVDVTKLRSGERNTLTSFHSADFPSGITTMGQAVLWVTEGDCLQRAGYLPETPSYAEWLKLGTIVEAR